MNDQNFKNLCLKVFYFCEILKMCEKIYLKSANSFCFCFIPNKEKMLTEGREEL